MSRFGVFWLPWLRTAALGSSRLKSAAAIDGKDAPRMLAQTQAYMGASICAEMGAPSARKDGPAMKNLTAQQWARHQAQPSGFQQVCPWSSMYVSAMCKIIA